MEQKLLELRDITEATHALSDLRICAKAPETVAAVQSGV